jgi:hypothetical protein
MEFKCMRKNIACFFVISLLVCSMLPTYNAANEKENIIKDSVTKAFTEPLNNTDHITAKLLSLNKNSNVLMFSQLVDEIGDEQKLINNSEIDLYSLYNSYLGKDDTKYRFLDEDMTAAVAYQRIPVVKSVIDTLDKSLCDFSCLSGKDAVDYVYYKYPPVEAIEAITKTCSNDELEYIFENVKYNDSVISTHPSSGNVNEEDWSNYAERLNESLQIFARDVQNTHILYTMNQAGKNNDSSISLPSLYDQLVQMQKDYKRLDDMHYQLSLATMLEFSTGINLVVTGAMIAGTGAYQQYRANNLKPAEDLSDVIAKIDGGSKKGAGGAAEDVAAERAEGVVAEEPAEPEEPIMREDDWENANSEPVGYVVGYADNKEFLMEKAQEFIQPMGKIRNVRGRLLATERTIQIGDDVEVTDIHVSFKDHEICGYTFAVTDGDSQLIAARFPVKDLFFNIGTNCFEIHKSGYWWSYNPITNILTRIEPYRAMPFAVPLYNETMYEDVQGMNLEFTPIDMDTQIGVGVGEVAGGLALGIGSGMLAKYVPGINLVLVGIGLLLMVIGGVLIGVSYVTEDACNSVAGSMNTMSGCFAQLKKDYLTNVYQPPYFG